jgi:hypothetical protein
MDGTVEAVCRNHAHEFSKSRQETITLLTGLGVEGDAHLGVTVKHRGGSPVTPASRTCDRCT